MSQPPESSPQPSPSQHAAILATCSPPQWRRPRGVAPGTWQYVNERSIADRYDAFVADTPLCRVDEEILAGHLPGVSKNAPESVLDLGCGSGRAAIPLANRGYHVVAIDLSLPMLQVLGEKVGQSKPDDGRIDPVQANLVELGCLANASADHAICLFSTLGMIQGRENRMEMLRHVARVVRPGGSFLLHVHNRWAALCERHGIGALAKSLWQSLRVAGSDFGDATYAYRGLDEMFMHRFSRRELLKELKKTGWTVSDLLPVSIEGSRIDRGVRIPGGYFVVASTARL